MLSGRMCGWYSTWNHPKGLLKGLLSDGPGDHRQTRSHVSAYMGLWRLAGKVAGLTTEVLARSGIPQ